MRDYPNPLIEQRADPFVLRHSDGYYYFTASVPEYDRLELRRARSINELSQASPTVVWQKPQQGPMSHLIWAPELHFINSKWYLYFAAAHSPEIADGLFQHRMFALECSAANPLTGDWVEKGRIYTHIDSFSSTPPTSSIAANIIICGRKRIRRSTVTPTFIWQKWQIPGRSRASR